MPAVLRDDILDKLERSQAYVVADIVFDWLGAVGELLLASYILWSLRTDSPRISRRVWLEVFLVSIALLSIKRIKDEILAWAGIAPPDHGRWFGPKQDEPVNAKMKPILDTQQRAERIRQRGIRVEEMLKENNAKFERQSRSTLG